MIQVGINGYGTIGKRVADAIVEQPDMTVLGVAKTRPNYEATAARQRGFALYSAVPERADQFTKAGLETAGEVDALVAESDIVVDATPSGIGAENKSLYETHDTPAIFQGGESHDLVDASFNSRSNFEQARGAEYVRVVSCNTTGLARLLAPLRESVGVQKVRATLVRRGGDPPQSGRGPINDILPNPVTLPSHHGPDVNTIFPDLDIDTLGLKVPATLMHMHSINVTMESAPDASEIRQLLDGESRLFLIDDTVDIEGTGALKDYTLDMGRPRGDLWENGIWAESLTVEGSDLYLFQAIHQESDVVPENVDAIRAMLETEDAQTSRERTNRALGIE